MVSKSTKKIIAMLAVLFLVCCSASKGSCNDIFEVKRVGNINPYAENAFLIRAEEGGFLSIRIHDNICVYRTISQRISAGETTIKWDGCGYNREKLYEKTYTITAELQTDSGLVHSVSFASPVEYALQCLQYALPSSDCLYLDSPEKWFLEYRTVTKGKLSIELTSSTETDKRYIYTLSTTGGRITRKQFDEIARKSRPEEGDYLVKVYEISRPDETYEFRLKIRKSSPLQETVTVTGEIMPDRSMCEEEIWKIMMQPSVVVDIDFFKHQNIYEQPDKKSSILGTLHGQTQGLKVLRIDSDWAMIGAWNHEEAAYVEGWVPLSLLKKVYPQHEYGILIDKQKQTLSVFREGKIMDTLLVSTGRAEKNNLNQETTAGCFLTGYHRVNFSMNGKKYDFVIQYDGGNLLHQTPYDWGQQKKDFTLGRAYLGAKASHACIRIQPEPGEGGLNAYWLFTHIPYHTRVIILDDPDERQAETFKLKRSTKDDVNIQNLHTEKYEKDTHEQTVTVTFAGNMIPGGTRSFNSRKESFISFVAQSGYEAPFSDIRETFEEDDLTCVSLGGLILGNSDTYPESKGIYCSPAGTEKILFGSSIEMILMANDRLMSGGMDIYNSTVNSVRLYADTTEKNSSVTVNLKGHVFGFSCCSESEYLKDPQVIDRRIQGLKEKNCEKIIFLTNWGDDHAAEHSIIQEAMAHRCVRAGASLVVGNHPGIIQGIDYIEGVPVIYSTGTLLDGSVSKKPKMQQGIIIRAVFNFDKQGEVTLITIPILPYGRNQEDKNEYCPTANMTYQEAADTIRSIWRDTTDQVMERVLFVLPDE